MKIRSWGFLATVLLWFCATVHAEQYTIPLFVAPSAGNDPQGVLRLANEAAMAASVEIESIDDSGTRTGPVTLTLGAEAAVELSATGLQSGNAAKGLPRGIGDFSGEVRLIIDSDVPIVPSAYVRGADGALSAMNATVLKAVGSGQVGGAGRDAYRYDVAVFHPASNVTQPSRLRLINPGEAAARVTIAARDDTGAAATGGTVELTLPAGGARTLSANQLEAGDNTAFTGRLGAGVGNWRLSVTSDRPLQAVNVTVGLGGEWRNLSSTGISGWAPTNHAAFEARFLGRAIVSRDGQNRVTFQVLANNRFTHTYMDDGVEVRQQSRYQYERTGRDAGLLNLDYDAGLSCEARFHFGSRRSGWFAFACVDAEDRVEIWTGGTWLSLDAGSTPLDLGSGPDDLIYIEGTAIDALTLPAANGGDGELTYSLAPQVPGLSFDPDTRRLSGTPAEAGIWTMTYRVRDASGDTDWLYFVLAVDTATVGRETTHTVGATLSDLPSGSWTPDVTSNGSFSLSGGDATVRLAEGGYIEEGGHRYTCQSAGGCAIENRLVTSGTVVQTASGTAPGGGVPGDHGDDRATATGIEAGSDTQGDLTAGDVDYFLIVIDAPGTLEAYTSGGTDTLGRLEDADGAVLGRNDDGGSGTNFRISEEVSPGTYYVRVEGYSSRVTGDYTLHVRFAESTAGTSPSFAAGSGPGNQTYAVGTAISALTLPAASGGGGALTYSLSPAVPGLIFNATATVRRLTGTPTASGTYNITYRVRDTDGDTDSLTFTITVTDSASEPDLAVESVSVSDSSPSAGASFTLSATVRNRGDGQSGSTTLRYYRSTNTTISRSDTQVGTDSVSGLAASRTSSESVRLTAPSSAGTYYYGACVDSVTGESDTSNNCSSGVRVTVSSGGDPGGGDGGCVEVNDVVELGEGESCTITQALVSKYSLNRVSVRVGDTARCSGGRVRLSFFSARSIHLNGLTIRCR